MSRKVFEKIESGLKDAIAGNFARVMIDGVTWVRQDRPGPEWQPIETAPKDNSAMLVYCPLVNFNFVATAFWDTAKCEWLLAWSGLGHSVKISNPTHWQPLPAPPPS